MNQHKPQHSVLEKISKWSADDNDSPSLLISQDDGSFHLGYYSGKAFTLYPGSHRFRKLVLVEISAIQHIEANKKLVLQVAAAFIEASQLPTWYETEILEGLGKTAKELVEEGRHCAVIKHLKRRLNGGYA